MRLGRLHSGTKDRHKFPKIGRSIRTCGYNNFSFKTYRQLAVSYCGKDYFMLRIEPKKGINATNIEQKLHNSW